MFSGIVEGLKAVVRVTADAERRSLAVDLQDLAGGVRSGDSVAIDGCCLTVTGLAGTVATFDVVGETLRLTTLGDLAPGVRVNVERSLRIGDQLGGHFVTGHVEGVGTILAKEARPSETWLTVELPAGLSDLVLHKGSIAFDGVSLTVAAVSGPRVSAALIPHTLARTTLGSSSTMRRTRSGAASRRCRAIMPP